MAYVTDTYAYKLSNSNTDTFSLQINIGKYNVQCDFVFPTFIQELYNNIAMQVDMWTKNDPIGSNHSYDYLNYYLSIPDGEERLFIDTATELPQSLANVPPATAAGIIVDRKAVCLAAKTLIDQYKEMLHWQCKVNDGLSEPAFIDVIPGGFHRPQDQQWSVRFVHADDTFADIGRDMLDATTMEFEVYDTI